VAVLVSLLGEQTHPALILAAMLKERLERVVLLGSAQTRQQGRHARAAIGLLAPVPVELREVAPYDWSAVEEAVGDLAVPGAIWDLTGGTKPMLVGAYRVAQAKGLPAVYLDTASQRVVSLTTAPVPESFDERLPDVDPVVLLRANGAVVTHSEPAYRLAGASRAVARWALQHPDHWRDWVSGRGRGGGRAGAAFAEQLVRQGLARRTPGGKLVFADGTEGSLFRGGYWLERWVADAFLGAGLTVLCDVRCRMEGDAGPPDGAVQNEFDVVTSRAARLHVVSCKSGKRVEGEHVEAFGNSARRVGGRFVRLALASLAANYQFLAPRVAAQGMALWGPAELLRLEGQSKQWLEVAS
jgi:hypothetical protein